MRTLWGGCAFASTPKFYQMRLHPYPRLAKSRASCAFAFASRIASLSLIVTHLPYPPQCRTHSLFPLHLSYVTLSNALCPLFSALRQFSINSLLSPQILKTMVRKEHPLAGFGDGNRWFIKKIYFLQVSIYTSPMQSEAIHALE